MLYHATILGGGSCLYFLILKETWLFVDQRSGKPRRFKAGILTEITIIINNLISLSAWLN